MKKPETQTLQGFPGVSDGKESACKAGDVVFISGLGRSPGGGHGNPLQVFLPGESPWTEEPDRLQSTGSQRLSILRKLPHYMEKI